MFCMQAVGNLHCVGNPSAEGPAWITCMLPQLLIATDCNSRACLLLDSQSPRVRMSFGLEDARLAFVVASRGGS